MLAGILDQPDVDGAIAALVFAAILAASTAMRWVQAKPRARIGELASRPRSASPGRHDSRRDLWPSADAIEPSISQARLVAERHAAAAVQIDAAEHTLRRLSHELGGLMPVATVRSPIPVRSAMPAPNVRRSPLAA